MKALIFSLVLYVFFTADIDWTNDYRSAQNTAITENKLIILNFSGSDWCGPCILLKKQVFETSEFQDLAKTNFILMRADFPRKKKNMLSASNVERNEWLAEKFNKQGKFPLTLLLDVSGKVLKEWDGYNGKSAEMISEFKKWSNEK